MKVALGESKKVEGYFTVDLYGEPDLIHDINNGLPFPDNSVDEIRAIHVVEHIHDLVKLFKEMYRVCKNGAIIHIETPLWNKPESWIDITHVHHLDERTPDFLCEDNYLSKREGWRFKLKSKKIDRMNLIFELVVMK